VEQLAEGAIHLLAEVDHHITDAARRVGAQRCRRVVVGKAAVFELGEDAGGDEGAKDAAQQRRADVHRLGDCLGGQGVRTQHVGDAEFRRHVQRLRELVAAADPHQCLLGSLHRSQSYARRGRLRVVARKCLRSHG
jgi:hypothetical protein